MPTYQGKKIKIIKWLIKDDKTNFVQVEMLEGNDLVSRRPVDVKDLEGKDLKKALTEAIPIPPINKRYAKAQAEAKAKVEDVG